MATVEYSVEASYSDIPYPVVVRKVIENEEVVSFSLISYNEALLSGVDLEAYFTLYRDYVQSYLNSLSTLSEDLDAVSADKHQDFHAGVSYFRSFMRGHWVEAGNEQDFI